MDLAPISYTFHFVQVIFTHYAADTSTMRNDGSRPEPSSSTSQVLSFWFPSKQLEWTYRPNKIYNPIQLIIPLKNFGNFIISSLFLGKKEQKHTVPPVTILSQKKNLSSQQNVHLRPSAQPLVELKKTQGSHPDSETTDEKASGLSWKWANFQHLVWLDC